MTADLRRVGRRQFLVSLGKGAMGLAVFGFAAACADDSSATTAASTTMTPTTRAGTSSTASTTTTEAPSTPREGIATVQRVNLGFVSAYIVARDGSAAVIDTGSSGSEGDIEAGLTTLGLGWPSVEHVIFTHHHNDHIGSARAVIESATGAQTYAGAEDVHWVDQWGPVNAVGDGDVVFGLDIVATPGHTPGHISVVDPAARFLIAGDALNGETDGSGVLGPNPQFTPDMRTAIASAVKLGTFAYDDAYFGHGEPLIGGASAAVAALAATLSA